MEPYWKIPLNEIPLNPKKAKVNSQSLPPVDDESRRLGGRREALCITTKCAWVFPRPLSGREEKHSTERAQVRPQGLYRENNLGGFWFFS